MEQTKNPIVTVVGLLTILWGVAHVALGLFGDLQPNSWVEPVRGVDSSRWVAAFVLFINAGTAFVPLGFLAIIAGVGVLFRLQCYRLLTLILAVAAILWGLAIVESWSHLDNSYHWHVALIPFAAIELLFGILVFVAILTNGPAFSTAAVTEESTQGKPIFTLLAWISPYGAVIISGILWLWFSSHQGVRGERASGVLAFYIFLLLVSGAGGVVAIVSFFGISSTRNALSIIPGALLGLCINGYNAFISFFAFALEGRNLGG